MKKLAIICALAMVMTMIAPFAAVSAATNTNGVLYWDFETTDDVGFFVHNSNVNSIYVAAESGAWVKEYIPNSEDSSWKYTVSQGAHSEITDIEALTNGGEKCLKLAGNAANNWNLTSNGACVLLPAEKLIPGMEYTIEFDILGQNSWGECTYIAFSKPSAYDKGGDSPTYRSRVPWLETGNGQYQEVSNTVSNAAWQHLSANITTPENLYENGAIRLHIAIASLTNQANAKTAYIDNVKITPTEEKPSYTKFTYGKVWDFESDYNVDGDGNYVIDGGIPGNANGGQNDMYPTTFANGDWSLYTETTQAWMRGPRIRKVSDAVLCANTMSSGNGTTDGADGAPAPGSEYCARVRVHNGERWNVGVLGMRVKLTKEEFPAGNYTLTLYSGYTGALSGGTTLNASVFAGDKLIDDEDDGVASSNNSVVEASFDGAVIDSQLLGKLGTHWGRYSTTLSITNECFDADGVATLILHTNIGQKSGDKMLYFDDISLVSDMDMLPDDGVVNGFVTNVSYTDYEGAMVAAGVYYDEDCTVLSNADTETGDLGGVTHSSFKLSIPAEDENSSLEWWPTGRIYMLDKFFAPILDTPIVF